AMGDQALLILHLIGLMLGVSGAFGSVISLASARPAQKQKGGPVRGVGPVFAHVATTGVVLLWPTGIALMVLREGPGRFAPRFLLKMVFVLALTFVAFAMEYVYSRGRRDPQVARLLPGLSPLASLSYIMAVIFSVLAFR